MTTINDGGPAFPVHGGHGDDDPRNRVLGGGMSLRDWFAGQALAHRWTNEDSEGNCPDPDKISEWAYWLADAMLDARAKGGAE